VAAALRDRNRYGPHHEPLICIEQEPGSSGVEAYKHIARKLAGFPVRPDRPTGAKEVRAEPWASQCAAKNVYLVEDGTWDIPGWIAEHCMFPLGKLKDRVDSASGAFGKLVNARPAGTLRVLRWGMRRDRRPHLRIVVCSRHELANTTIPDEYCLLVSFADPAPVGKTDLPPHGLDQLLDSLVLPFADLDPADHQETWNEPIPPYGQTADKLIMDRAAGKKLWGFLLRRRDPGPAVFVFQDDGDRRALSVAYGVAYVLRAANPTIQKVGQEEWTPKENDVPPNKHIFEMTKATRETVM
jgi:hypothetical protein